MSDSCRPDTHMWGRTPILLALGLAVALPLGVVPSAVTTAAEAGASSQLSWSTVANVADLAPGTTKNFNSFNQPSVNADGTVVFRARTKGESQPVRGVYTRDTDDAGSAIVPVAEVGGAVPAPNNSDGTFNEFPAFPRIDATGSMVATRGQSTPVLTYTLPDGTDTKVGTSGVYATVGGTLTSGATLLGNIPEYAQYAVPDSPVEGTRFDQFPGAPAVDGSTIVFKGNYTVGTSGLTGVYFRDLGSPDQPVSLIAGATTRIPNQPAADSVLFGSTAPPSAAAGKAVFSGWDNEAAPTMGGIYLAPITASPALTTVVGIGDPVPGQGPDARFTNVGEGLSFDGRYVGFWASWGEQMRSIVLTCPTDGNKDIVEFCLQQHPNGFTTSVPVHQGVFVADTSTTPATIHPVATSGPRFDGFQYWVFSGRPPGTGGGDEVTLEPARWRSSAFVALSSDGLPSGEYQVAFKASPVAGGSGIYLAQGPSDQERVVTAVDTAAPGTVLDPMAPAASWVTTVGVERDAFRGRWLAINASMLDPATTEAWGGIYLARVPAMLALEQQVVTITSSPPAEPMAGGTYTITALADSGLPVTFSIDAATTNHACSITGSTVRLEHAGTCVVDADQPGDAAYAAATRVKQSFTVRTAPTTVLVSTAPTTYGQDTTATATVTAPIGSPTGEVQFAVDDVALGDPVAVHSGSATSPAIVGSGGLPLAAGTYELAATFTPADPTVFAGGTGSAALVVAPAATTISLAVTSSTVVATVTRKVPGAGAVSGVVEFSVGGVAVGQAPLVDGVATLNHVVPSGSSQTVAAVYAGDGNFSASSTSMARHDPTIRAKLTSTYPRTAAGWYRSPVTVTFTCTTHGAPLTAPCPAPVRLARSGGGQTVTRTIAATDGGMATVVVSPVNIDLRRPSVRVAGVRDGGVYRGQAPAVRCVATDSLSGVARCTITRRTSGDRTTYKATAVDRAGNVATVTGSYTVLKFYVQGVRYSRGVFQLRAGTRYLVVAYATSRPTYYYATVHPRVPTVRDHTLYAAGYHRWVIGITPSYGMRSWPVWHLGVRTGSTMHLIHVHVG
ncbi:MAG: hypothetical protein GC157_16020 [Frankiales bacterium]|nr:hypothetical protein [Frankiales bacterium]